MESPPKSAKRSALVLGGAACVWQDVDEAFKLFTPDVIAAVNNVGLDYAGRVDHWFSLHIRPTRDWIGLRAALRGRIRMGRNRPTLWTGSAHRFVDRHVHPCWCSEQGGDSGLLAVQGLLSLGIERIVLAGVPVTAMRHYFDSEPWGDAAICKPFWLAHLDEMKPYVRSIGGWTRELLSYPTKEWLCGLAS